jgi:thioredoxin reductase (NADPH)
MDKYDVAIIGAGPSGITAAIYCARYKLKTILISKELGGYVGHAVMIGNFPGYNSIPGFELVKKYMEQIKSNNIEYKRESANEIKVISEDVSIKTNKGEYIAKYLIYALGTEKRKLKCPGEDMPEIYFCATCDAPMTQDKEVVVAGGNDSGTSAALLISEYAKKVTIVEIAQKLPSEPIWVEKIKNSKKIDIVTGDSIKEIIGREGNHVSKVILNSGRVIFADAIFVEIGSYPRTDIAKKIGIKLDQYDHIDVDKTQKTNIDRIYAAGDVTNSSNYMRQIVAAQAEGAMAAQAIYKRIQGV